MSGCVCRRVYDRELARHARAAMDFDNIQFETGVATQCGQCEGCAARSWRHATPDSRWRPSTSATAAAHPLPHERANLPLRGGKMEQLRHSAEACRRQGRPVLTN